MICQKLTHFPKGSKKLNLSLSRWKNSYIMVYDGVFNLDNTLSMISDIFSAFQISYTLPVKKMYRF